MFFRRKTGCWYGDGVGGDVQAVAVHGDPLHTISPGAAAALGEGDPLLRQSLPLMVREPSHGQLTKAPHHLPASAVPVHCEDVGWGDVKIII